jgi:hypothetical protein
MFHYVHRTSSGNKSGGKQQSGEGNSQCAGSRIKEMPFVTSIMLETANIVLCHINFDIYIYICHSQVYNVLFPDLNCNISHIGV